MCDLFKTKCVKKLSIPLSRHLAYLTKMNCVPIVQQDDFFSLDLLDKLHSNALEIVIQKAFQFISVH